MESRPTPADLMVSSACGLSDLCTLMEFRCISTDRHLRMVWIIFFIWYDYPATWILIGTRESGPTAMGERNDIDIRYPIENKNNSPPKGTDVNRIRNEIFHRFCFLWLLWTYRYALGCMSWGGALVKICWLSARRLCKQLALLKTAIPVCVEQWMETPTFGGEERKMQNWYAMRMRMSD